MPVIDSGETPSTAKPRIRGTSKSVARMLLRGPFVPRRVSALVRAHGIRLRRARITPRTVGGGPHG